MSTTPYAHLAGESGAPVVLLHGIGGDGTIWVPQLQTLADRFRLLAWDMPGYGSSAPLEEMTFPALADALVDLLDAAGIERAHLVGHSMGGMIAQVVAARHAERVASLLLCATSASFGRPDGDFQKEWVRQRLAPLEEGAGMKGLAPGAIAAMVGEDPDPEGVALAVECMSSVPEESYRAAVHCIVGFDGRDALAQIAVPTLLLAGERDGSAPLKALERMQAAIPDADLVCVEGAGHLLPIEQPEAFNEIAAGFLAEVSEA